MCFAFTGLGSTVIAQLKYPTARTEPFDTVIYGKKISDEYFWMSRKKHEKEMTEFSRQQSLLARGILDSIPGSKLIEKQWDDILDAMKDEIWSASANGKYIYYNKDFGKEGVWYCRRKGIDATEEKIMGRVRLNGQQYSVRKRMLAHNKPLLALMLTQRGESNPHIRIYDMDKREFLGDSIAPVMFNDSRGVSMTWLPGDNGILYTQAPPSEKHGEKYFNGRIKMHTVGTPPSNDEVIFGIGENRSIKLEPHETPYIYSFKHSPYLITRVRAGDKDNYAFAVHTKNLNGKNTPWKKLNNYINLGDGFDAKDKFLYAATKGAPGYRVVKIDMETGASPQPFWEPNDGILAVTDMGHSSGVIAGEDVLYILIRKVGDMRIMEVDLQTGSASTLPVDLKGGMGSMSLHRKNDLLFAASAATRSVQYFHYSHAQQKSQPLPFADQVYDAGHLLESSVVWVPSRDGRKIPVSLLYKKGLDLKNVNPLLIEGYGNSGASTDPALNLDIFPWVLYGGVHAYAHVRGGGELGEAWTKEGQFPHKMNSINDAVDVADFFIKNKYTSPAKQLIMGGSAGSFLVGNAINQRPDLFAGGLFLGGLPDLATNQNAAEGREQKSTGFLNTKEGFESRYSISSYYHIPPQTKLPAMLIVHGATDYILSMHPAARYTAKLQQAQKGDRPILFLVHWEGGHSGSGSEALYILKFALWQTGHPDFQLKW